jgi:putative photosynthetic complex assembly protein
MTDRTEPARFPQLPLAGAAALVAIALVATASAKLSEVGTSRLTYIEPATERQLRFEDRADGAVAVLSASDDRPVAHMPAGTNGFVRMVMRGLARDRQAKGIGAGPPFTLTRWSDGRLTISDSETARRIELTGFGKDNVNAFANLLLAGSDAK